MHILADYQFDIPRCAERSLCDRMAELAVD
jgi:hypothetical protein